MQLTGKTQISNIVIVSLVRGSFETRVRRVLLLTNRVAILKCNEMYLYSGCVLPNVSFCLRLAFILLYQFELKQARRALVSITFLKLFAYFLM